MAYIAYVAFLHYAAEQSDALLYTTVGVAGAIGCAVGLYATRMVIIVATALYGAASLVSCVFSNIFFAVLTVLQRN